MSSDISHSPPAEHGYVEKDSQAATQHHETMPDLGRTSTRGWKLSSKGQNDGDTALALFADVDDFHATVDPVEEKKLVRKIDLMILPYLGEHVRACFATAIARTQSWPQTVTHEI